MRNVIKLLILVVILISFVGYEAMKQPKTIPASYTECSWENCLYLNGSFKPGADECKAMCKELS